MMEEGEQIKHTCMKYGVCSCPHNWSKGEGAGGGRMLVQQHTLLVVGMSSVTKRGSTS